MSRGRGEPQGCFDRCVVVDAAALQRCADRIAEISRGEAGRLADCDLAFEC